MIPKDQWEKSIPGHEEGLAGGPEAGTYQPCLRNSKEAGVKCSRVREKKS